MVAKCANPRCNHGFRYVSQGKLYLFGHQSIEQALWLCPQCASRFEIVLDGNSNPVLTPRSSSAERKAENLPIRGRIKEGDRARANERLPSQSLIEWTVSWLESRERQAEREQDVLSLPANISDYNRSSRERGAAGGVCRRSGVHKVIHHRHRSAHQAILHEGEVFPACRGCGTQVSFEFLQPLEAAGEVEHIGYDWDFLESVWGAVSGGES